MKSINISITLLFLTGFVSCTSTRSIIGTYHSNFAEMDFFSTRVKLNIDSSFEYRFRGDLIFDTATGFYKVFGNKLILTYNPRPIDTSQFKYLREIGVKVSPNLKSDAGLPHLFYIRKNKLFHSNQEDGTIVRKAIGYSKRRKYLIFGTHYYKRKHYLRIAD